MRSPPVPDRETRSAAGLATGGRSKRPEPRGRGPAGAHIASMIAFSVALGRIAFEVFSGSGW